MLNLKLFTFVKRCHVISGQLFEFTSMAVLLCRSITSGGQGKIKFTGILWFKCIIVVNVSVDLQMVSSSQGAQVKLSDGSVKTVTAAAGHLSKPGTTTLRMTGGVITAASSTPSSLSAAAAGNLQQVRLAVSD